VLAPAPAARHPGFLLATIVTAAGVALSVSFVLFDTDMWQHLGVGRAIWQLKAIPTHQLWTWPNYGAPDVNASWGFRFLIWPIWHALGVPGLFAWRWTTTLAAFGLLWAAARRMGAVGFAPLVVAVLCSLTYRHRSQVRPETLVAVLFAAEIWILESWRAARARAPEQAAGMLRDPRAWLILIALLWANVHISYWVGLAVQAIYALPVLKPAATGSERRDLRTPLVILLLSAVISLVNPWGWQALWQPFDYFLHWRHEPIFQTIGELQPIDWAYHARGGLAVLIAGWAVLAIWRARVIGFDLVEALMLALFLALALPTRRFVGMLALAAFPFAARDLDAWLRTRSWYAPHATRAWLHGVLTAAFCVAIGVPEWTRPSMPAGLGIDPHVAPSRACDFMEAHGVRGRGLNPFDFGGYQMFRFWPDRSRLPFIDIHQSGSREDRYLYAVAQQDHDGWRTLDAKYRFDYVLVHTHQYPNDRLPQFLDADTTSWALVFTDDAAGLFIRRDGALASVAREFSYRRLPAGIVPLKVLEECRADPVMRRELEGELRRAMRASPWNGRATLLLAPLLMLDHRLVEAHALLDTLIERDPRRLEARAARGEIELVEGRPAEARADFAGEIRLAGESAYLDQSLARCFARLGDKANARAWYRKSVRLDPDDAALRDSLGALD